jgi:hypothetical protein
VRGLTGPVRPRLVGAPDGDAGGDAPPLEGPGLGLEGALWLEPCRQVHTYRMRFAIDVAHLDRRGRVLAVRSMPPGRMGPLLLRTRSILEAEAGSFARWGVAPGATVGHADEPGADGADQPTHSGSS